LSPDHLIGQMCGIGTSKFFWDQEIFAFCESSSCHFNGCVPTSSAESSFKKLLLGTGLWHHAKMSTSLKSPDGLKDAECKKGQLSHWPPILYAPVVDIITPKEEPQVFKIKLPDLSHLSSRPRKSLRSSRSSFLMRPTSACPFTPVGTIRNTLRT
jgi:hypothetical protein